MNVERAMRELYISLLVKVIDNDGNADCLTEEERQLYEVLTDSETMRPEIKIPKEFAIT